MQTYKINGPTKTISLKKIFWLIIILLDITIMVGVVYADRWVGYLVPKASAMQAPADPALDTKYPINMDPNRPYFDMWGNRFDYMGNLLTVSKTCRTDPISNQPNPYCPSDQKDNNVIDTAPVAPEGGMK